MQQEQEIEKKSKAKILPAKNAPHLPGGSVIFLSVVSVLQLLLFFLHYMIYETLGAAFGIGGLWLAIPLFVLSATFISASIISSLYSNVWIRIYYKIAGVWFSFVAPLCGACFGFAVFECVLPFVGVNLSPEIAGIVCFGAAIIATLYGIWNSTRAQIVRIAIKLPNLPEFWKGKKVAFFADSHLGDLWGAAFAAKIVKKINALAPEAVFIGGDLFDGVKCDAKQLVEPLKGLQPPLGVYFVTGNHEYIRGTELFFEAIVGVGIKMLRDEVVDLRGIQLAGVDYKDKKEILSEVLERLDVESDSPSILLKHVPDHLDLVEHAGFSLSLSGHTHRGQFWPLSYITNYVFKGFDYGLKNLGNLKVYTTSGVGTGVSPFRFGTKSEIVEIEFV